MTRGLPCQRFHLAVIFIVVQYMLKKPLIIANWKMYKTQTEARDFVQTLKQQNVAKSCNLIVAGSYVLLPILAQELKNTPFQLSAQNMFYEEQGAFTGEVSPLQLKELGVTYVILGHSERRALFGENDTLINKKIMAGQKNNIIPILCVGENLDQQKNDKTEEVISMQLKNALLNITAEFKKKIIIAYEPVWAIGTGKNATPKQVQQIHSLIKRLTSEDNLVIYGGSVKSTNARELISQPAVAGFLVGGESLKIESFVKIISNTI